MQKEFIGDRFSLIGELNNQKPNLSGQKENGKQTIELVWNCVPDLEGRLTALMLPVLAWGGFERSILPWLANFKCPRGRLTLLR